MRNFFTKGRDLHVNAGRTPEKRKNSAAFYARSVGDRLNVTRATISNWERGISEPSYDALRQLSVVFCIDFLADFHENAPQQHENTCIFRVNAREPPVIEVISHENACDFSEITVDCSVNCVDQHGNALKFRLFAPFCIETTVE